MYIDNGESIDSDFYPQKDDEINLSDEEVDPDMPMYQEVEEERFNCCAYHNNANWLSRVLFFWPSAIIRVS